MKVYCFKPSSSYQGGCIIVAANSPLEALGVIYTDSPSEAEYTDIKHCVEVTSLTTNLEKPEIVINAFFV